MPASFWVCPGMSPLLAANLLAGTNPESNSDSPTEPRPVDDDTFDELDERQRALMKPNDLDDRIDATAPETDRIGADNRPESTALETGYVRTPSLYARLQSDVPPSGSIWELRVAGGFVAAAVLCFVGGLVAPAGQQVLFALAGIGLFAGVLVYGLSSGRVIEAADGERVYGTCADNLEAIVSTLGATDERLYVPSPSDGVRLLVSTGVENRLQETTTGSVVDPQGRGLLLRSIGFALYDEFERALTEPVAGSPEPLAEQLTDALCHRFEFVTDADPTVHVDERRAEIAVSGSAFGPVDRFDHPVASFLAVGFAAGLDREVSLEVASAADGRVWLVSCRWGAENASR